jgi:hypothetical protein
MKKIKRIASGRGGKVPRASVVALPSHSGANSRSRSVGEAFFLGLCVECGAVLVVDPGSFRCPHCGWSGEFQTGPTG